MALGRGREATTEARALAVGGSISGVCVLEFVKFAHV